MQFEKKLFKMSLGETFLYFTLMFILYNGFFFIISLFEGKPRFLAYEGSWILQFVFPVFYAVIQTAINRNAVLKVTEYPDSDLLKKEINAYLIGRGYINNSAENQAFTYVRKSKWGRIWNLFLKDNINIQVSENEISIYAKKNRIDSLLMKFKYNPNNK
jgi:hypothetical protein